MTRTTVAEVVADGLRRAGTPRIFGVPGVGTSLSLLAAARARDLPLALAYGESAACVMAAVTADLTGTPGAALAGAGPGFAAAVTGAGQAALDRSPLILLTDRHPGTMLACKASLGLTADTAAQMVGQAVRLALGEPRGPVHLDVPPDVADAPTEPLANACHPEPLPPPAPAALDEAARLLGSASRPVLVAGLGCRTAGGAPWLRALAEALPAPVLATPKAKGIIPDPHPLMLGVVTSLAEPPLLSRADLIVALGLDPIETPTAEWPTAVPMLLLTPSSVASHYDRAVVEIVGDIGLVIAELAPRLRDRARADWDMTELDGLKRRAVAQQAEGGIVRRVVRVAREATEAGTIASVDAGAHAADVATGWDAVGPGEFLVSNARSKAGFALPAAIAAHLVHPDRRVVCFTDGPGLVAAASELETATRLRAPIIVVAFGDGGSTAPDPLRLAQSFGVPGLSADAGARFSAAMERALGVDGPAVIAVWP